MELYVIHRLMHHVPSDGHRKEVMHWECPGVVNRSAAGSTTPSARMPVRGVCMNNV